MDNERAFLHDLKTKEDGKKELSAQMNELRSALQDKTLKIEYLEKVRKDYQATEQNLKRNLEIK